MSLRFPKPREFKKRICFRCKRPIEFGEFYIKNKDMTKERLIELWQNENLQFYCCLCYEILKSEYEAKELKEKLSKKEKDIINILEIKIGKKLPLLSTLTYNSIGFTIQNRNIVGLSLFKMELEEFPLEILYLHNLQMLNLAWNSLDSIPPSISSLQLLRELDLIGNHILNIPETIVKLKNLEVIDLSFNNIETVPECIGDMDSLRLLKLIRNNIIDIPHTIKKAEIEGLKLLL